MQKSTPLFFQRRFFPMWLGQSLGALADNMNRQILAIGVTYGAIPLAGIADGQKAIPLIGAFFPIAMLLASPLGGQFAEKFETAFMFRRTKIMEVALMVIAALGLLFNAGWFVVFALFGMGLQSAFFNPVRQAAMPKYLSSDELVRGNGLCNAGLYVAILLGFGLGGFLIGNGDRGRELAAAGPVCFFCARVPRRAFCAPDDGPSGRSRHPVEQPCPDHGYGSDHVARGSGCSSTPRNHGLLSCFNDCPCPVADFW